MEQAIAEHSAPSAKPFDGAARSFLSAALMILCGAALLMIGPIASRQPVIYSDVRSYYELGEQIGETIKIVRPQAVQPSPPAPKGETTAVARDPRLALTMAGARSPTYAFLFFLEQHFLGAWAIVALQALAVSVGLFMLLAAVGRSSDFVWIILGLAFLSSLPLLIGFLMPDVFTALASIALIYMVTAKRLAPAGSAVMTVALAFSLSAHLSNILIVVPPAILGLSLFRGLRLGGLGDILRRGGLIALAVALALSSYLAYGAAIRVLKHDTLKSPPFLTARLLEDGPGRRYLAVACKSGDAYALCRYKGRPLNNSDDFLWSFNSAAGVFELADYDTRVALIQEQSRFVLGTIRFDPVGVTAAALRNAWTELTSFKADESYIDPAIYFTNPSFAIFSQILPGGEACLTAPHACAPKLDIGAIDIVMLCGSILSLLIVAAFIPRALKRDRRSALIVMVALCFFVSNAAICGVLSRPAERYQTRVEWLLPFSALLLATSFRRKGPDSERSRQ